MNISTVVAFLASVAICVDRVRAADTKAPTAAAATSSSSSSSTIIYIIIAVVVLLFIAGAIFVWMRSRSRAKDRDLPTHELPAPQPRQQMSGQQQSHSQQQQMRQPNGQSSQQPGNYQGYRSPAERRNTGGNGNSNANYQDPQRPGRQQGYDNRSNPNAPPAAAPRRPSNPSGGASGGKGQEKRPTRANETAARVLAEFQSDPALCRRKVPYAALYFTRVLSKGAFGEVWLAQLENRQVAVKRILNEKKNDEKEIECFAAEIKLMASFYHPKIVEFVGVSWSTLQDLCAVTEYMAKGDLYGFLKRKNGQLNWRDHKIYLAEDIADALGYLHSLTPKVIHRDLKSKNILLDDSFRAKLSDFGISRERSLEETMTAGVGTIYWTAPEVLMGKKYTEKADIYSFGIVMSEIDTHEVPYSDLRDEAGKKLQGMKIVQQVIKKKLRPTFANACPAIVRELAARCLDSEPDVRPDAIELLHLVQRLQQQL